MEIRTIAATVALLVVAGCSSFTDAEDPEPTTTSVPRAEKVAAVVETGTDELFDELVTFVEEARGFRFETPRRSASSSRAPSTSTRSTGTTTSGC